MHALGNNFSTHFQEYLEYVEKSKQMLGIVPDMSIFTIWRASRADEQNVAAAARSRLLWMKSAAVL